jgi:hypothetical protein
MKQYNGEKAIISLTSWKARINTVSKTLYSLIQQCPGFHIVLCLSEEEFPKKEAELPDDLMLFVENDLIEILWVYKNYKSFKKVLFTMDKYREVPIISADDDCLYKCNYAEELYQEWLKHKDCFVTINITLPLYKKITCHGCGAASLHPPHFYENAISFITDEMIDMSCDDAFYMILRTKFNLPYKTINRKIYQILQFHDDKEPLSKTYMNRGTYIFNRYEAIINEHYI